MDHATEPIKVGVITDQTGPLSFMGIANANVARMVDRRHQRAGRPAGPAARAVPRRQRDDRQRRGSGRDQARPGGPRRCDPRRHLQLHAAGHQGPGGRRGQDALHLPRAVRGAGVRPAHLLHRPGAGAADRAAHPLADAARPGAKTFYLPSADYIWPHVLNEKVREVVTANGGSIVGEEYFPLDHTDYARDRRADHRRAVPTSSSTRSFRPGSRRSSSSSTTPASRSAAGISSAPTSTRTS